MIIQATPMPAPRLDGLGAHMFDRRQNKPGSGFAGLSAHVFDTRQNKMHLRGLAGLGDDGTSTTPAFVTNPIYRLLAAASMGASAYHGYKRNHSFGWAIGWGLLGGLFPVITPAVAVAQGFGKRK